MTVLAGNFAPEVVLKASFLISKQTALFFPIYIAGDDPRGRPRGPWPPPSDQGALDHGKSALTFGAKHVKVPQVEGKVPPIWGQKRKVSSIW